MADGGTTQHLVKFVADIKDIEDKIKAISALVKNLSKEASKVRLGDISAPSAGAAGGKPTSQRRRKAEQKAEKEDTKKSQKEIQGALKKTQDELEKTAASFLNAKSALKEFEDETKESIASFGEFIHTVHALNKLRGAEELELNKHSTNMKYLTGKFKSYAEIGAQSQLIELAEKNIAAASEKRLSLIQRSLAYHREEVELMKKLGIYSSQNIETEIERGQRLKEMNVNEIQTIELEQQKRRLQILREINSERERGLLLESRMTDIQKRAIDAVARRRAELLRGSPRAQVEGMNLDVLKTASKLVDNIEEKQAKVNLSNYNLQTRRLKELNDERVKQANILKENDRQHLGYVNAVRELTKALEEKRRLLLAGNDAEIAQAESMNASEMAIQMSAGKTREQIRLMAARFKQQNDVIKNNIKDKDRLSRATQAYTKHQTDESRAIDRAIKLYQRYQTILSQSVVARHREAARLISPERDAEALVRTAGGDTRKLSLALQKLSEDVTRASVSIQRSPIVGFTERLGKITSWMTSVWSLFGAIAAARSAVQTISDVETAIIDLRKVMDESTTNFAQMRKELFSLAREFGQLPKVVGEVMFLFARQGKEQAEILNLTRVALMAMNVADLSAADAVEMLTAATLQLNISAADSIILLDSWNEVSNRNAVSAKDLGEAFKLSASLADGLGISIHELNAMITILAANTGRTGSEIGRTLRFALTRAFTPGAQNALNAVGIATKDLLGNMRPLGTVLMEVAQAWDTYNDSTKQAIAFALGGTRHVNEMRILFENLGTMGVKVAEESLNSFGSAAIENAKYMQSFERRVASLQASIQEIVVTLGDSGLLDVLKLGVDGLRLFLNTFNSLPDVVKGTILAFTLAKVTGFALQKGLAALGIQSVTTSATVGTLAARVSALSLSSITATGAVSALGAAARATVFRLVAMINPITAVVGLVLSLAYAYNRYREYATYANERSLERINTLRSLQKAEEENLQSMEGIREKINELNSLDLTSEEIQARKIELLREFNEVSKMSIKNYDEMASSIDRYIRAKEEELGVIAKSSEREREAYLARLESDAARTASEIERIREGLSSFRDAFVFDDKTDLMTMTDIAKLLPSKDWMHSIQRSWSALLEDFTPTVSEFSRRQFVDSMLAEMDSYLAELEEKLRMIHAERKRLDELTEEAVFASTSSMSADDLKLQMIDRFGEYIYQIEEFVKNEGALRQELDTRLEHINHQLEASREIVSSMGALFDNTTMGLDKLIDSIGMLNEAENKLLSDNLRAARTMLSSMDEPDDELRSERYFALLNKIVEIDSRLNESINQKRESLNRAWDAGVIGAGEYLVQLNKIEESRAFEKQREQVRKLMEDLKTGIESAYRGFFTGALRGEEDFAKRMVERINQARADALGTGIANVFLQSRWMRHQIAQEQNLLATLFGGRPSDFQTLESRQVEISEDIKENTDKMVETLDELLDIYSPSGGGGIWEVIGQFAGWVSAAAASLMMYNKAVSDGTKVVEGELVPQTKSITERLTETLESVKEAVKNKFNELSEAAKETAKDLSEGGETISEIVAKLAELPMPRWSTEGLKLPDVPGWDKDKLSLPQLPGWSNELVDLLNPQPLMRLYNDVQISLAELMFLHRQNVEDINAQYANIEAPQPQFADIEVSISEYFLKNKDKFENAINEFGGSLEALSDGIGSVVDSQLLRFQQTMDLLNSLYEYAQSNTISDAEVKSHITNVEDNQKRISEGWARQIEAMAQSGVEKGQAAASRSPEEKLLAEIISGGILAGAIGASAAPMVLMDAAALLEFLKRLGVAVPQVGHASGGYTGPGGTFQPAGIVHKGEWVAPKWLVEKYPDLIAMLEGIRRRGYWLGGMAGSPPPWPVITAGSLSPVPDVVGAVNRGLDTTASGLRDVTVRLAEKEKIFKSLTPTLSEFDRKLKDLNTYISGEEQARQAGKQVKGALEGMGLPSIFAGEFSKGIQEAVRYLFRSVPLLGTITNLIAPISFFVRAAELFTKNYSLGQLLGFSSGGYTGQGGRNEIAGFVHKGEYVIPAWMVDSDPDLIAALEKRRLKGYQDGGRVGFTVFGPSGFESVAEKYLRGIEENTRYTSENISGLEEAMNRFRLPYESTVLGRGAQRTQIYPVVAPARPTVLPMRDIDMPLTLEDLMGDRFKIPGMTHEESLGIVREMLEQYDIAEIGRALVHTSSFKELVGRGLTPRELAVLTWEASRLFPTQEELLQAIDVWDRRLADLIVTLRENSNYIRQGFFKDRSDIRTVVDALTDPEQMRDALSAAMYYGTQFGPNAALLGGLGALYRGTAVFDELGITETLANIKGINENLDEAFTGLGILLDGMTKNIEKRGSGLFDVIGGMSMITGVGVGWIPGVASLLSSIFNRQKEEAREAERITSIRRFIDTGEMFGMHERFYMSGRHAALTGGATIDQSVKVETQINIETPNGTPDEIRRAVEQGVSDALKKIPSGYQREIDRGVYVRY